MFFQKSELFTLSGCFKEKMLESNYSQHKLVSNSRRVRILCIITGIAYLSALFHDFTLLDRTQFTVMLCARLVTFGMALFTFAATFIPKRVLLNHLATYLYIIAIIATESIEVAYKPQLGEQTIPFLAFVLLTYYQLFPTTARYAATSGIIGSLVYMATLYFHNHIELAPLSTIGIAFVFINIIGLYFQIIINRSHRNEFYSQQKLKHLNRQLENEINERKKAESQLFTLAVTDELTGIFNRRHFNTVAEIEIERTWRKSHELQLLFLDIDFFKRVNDTYGHTAGDQVLKGFTAMCSKNIRKIDILGRYGGEEFALLLPETSREQGVMIAERIRNYIEKSPIKTESHYIAVTVSIGITSITSSEKKTLEQLLKEADTALYSAKSGGRNRVINFDEIADEEEKDTKQCIAN